jgi:hypothetical protein
VIAQDHNGVWLMFPDPGITAVNPALTARSITVLTTSQQSTLAVPLDVRVETARAPTWWESGLSLYFADGWRGVISLDDFGFNAAGYPDGPSLVSVTATAVTLRDYPTLQIYRR